MKGRTDRCPNRGTNASADNAGWRGMDESRSDGKHVGTQRGLVPRRIGTAASGSSSEALAKEEPVRWVVWDPWLALAVSHGDPIRLVLFGLTDNWLNN